MTNHESLFRNETPVSIWSGARPGITHPKEKLGLISK
jgi:hypothetical protein